MAVSVDEVFDRIIEESVDKRQQGTKWERAVQWFLTQDPAWKDQFDHVWLWDDAPTNPGRQDTGIDLVAQDMDGEYWAIPGEMLFEHAVGQGRGHVLHGVDGRHTLQAFHHRGHSARGEPQPRDVYHGPQGP